MTMHLMNEKTSATFVNLLFWFLQNSCSTFSHRTEFMSRQWFQNLALQTGFRNAILGKDRMPTLYVWIKEPHHRLDSRLAELGGLTRGFWSSLGRFVRNENVFGLCTRHQTVVEPRTRIEKNLKRKDPQVLINFYIVLCRLQLATRSN